MIELIANTFNCLMKQQYPEKESDLSTQIQILKLLQYSFKVWG